MNSFVFCLLMTVPVLVVESEQHPEESMTICNLNTCTPDILKSGKNELYEEASGIAECLTRNPAEKDNFHNQARNLICVVSNIKESLGCNDSNTSQHGKNAVQLFCEQDFEAEVSSGQDVISEYDCVQCVLLYFLKLSVLSNANTVQNSSTNIEEPLKENLSTLILLTYFKLTKLHYHRLQSIWIKQFLDVSKWEKDSYLNTSKIKLDETMHFLRREKLLSMHSVVVFDKYFPVVIISYIVIFISFLGNGLLLILMLLYKDLRKNKHVMIINQTIGHFLYLVTDTVMIFFPSVVERMWNGEQEGAILGVAWCILHGVCVFSVMLMSIQRYHAVVSMKRSSESSHGIFSYYTLTFIVWFLSTAAAIPILYLYSLNSFRHWKIVFAYNLLVYSLIPITIVTTFLIATSRKLRQSVVEMPGENAGQQTVRNSRGRSAKILIVLSISYTLSYFPPFLVEIFSIFEDVPPDTSVGYFVTAHYIFVFLNSFIDPFALLAVSATYRRCLRQCIFCNYCSRSCSRNSIAVEKNSETLRSEFPNLLVHE